MENNDILFEEISGKEGDIGLITLNRQQVLNALNHEMFLTLDACLEKWEQQKNIKAVVIRASAGRAFCAGGDVRYVYEKGKQHDPHLHYFFRDEYRLNRRIYHYSKPYIALMNGITMGGGVGISIHGSHKVVTKNYQFAMPETGIGLFPDVGGSFFLPRIPHLIGYYLALTGARINYNDALAIGIVDALIDEDNLPLIIEELAKANFGNDANETVNKIIHLFAMPYEDSLLMQHKTEIELCFSEKTIEEIFLALAAMPSKWCQDALTSLKHKSPTSLKITLKELQKGKTLTFDECMKMEYRLVNHFIKDHDFYEGVRALIIDKDQKPNWLPNTLKLISNNKIDSYFSPLSEELV